MAPAMVPGSVPEAPDPAGTTWGVWEKRINWLVTILVLAATAYLSIKESLRPPSVLGPVPPVPVIIEPSPVDVPPPTSDVSTGILSVLAAGLSAPFGCSAAQIKAWEAFGWSVAECLASKCKVPEGVVKSLRYGGWGDFADEGLACGMGCLAGGVFGNIVLAKGEDRQVVSYFGTSTEVRTVPVVRVRVERPVP